MLEWKTLVPSKDRRFFVKGTELSCAIIPCCRSRFCIYEVRCLDENGQPDVFYRIRDAEGVSDADLKSGVRPPVVMEFRDPSTLYDIRFLLSRLKARTSSKSGKFTWAAGDVALEDEDDGGQT